MDIHILNTEAVIQNDYLLCKRKGKLQSARRHNKRKRHWCTWLKFGAVNLGPIIIAIDLSIRKR